MEKRNKVKLSNKKKIGLFSILFVTIIFIFSLNLASAIYSVNNATLIQSSNGNNGGQPYKNTIFSPDGIHVYEVDDGEYAPFNVYIYQGTTLDNFDITTVTFSDIIALPKPENFTTSSDYVSAYWISDNGSNAYFNFYHPPNANEIRHYFLSQPFNFSTMVYVDRWQNPVIQSPVYNQITSIYVTPDSKKIILGVRFYQTSYPNTFLYEKPYFFRLLNGDGNLYPYNFERATMLHNETSYSVTTDGLNLIGKSTYQDPNMTIYQYPLKSTYDFSSLTQFYSLNVNDSHVVVAGDFSSKPLIYQKDGGIFLIVNDFNINNDALYYRKFTLNNATITITINVSSGNNNPVVTTIINPFLSAFPDENTLTSNQKYAYVVITMLLIAIILLLGVGSILKSVPTPLIYITLVIELITFIFFISIGYISVGLLIILALMGLGIGYVMIKARGSGGT